MAFTSTHEALARLIEAAEFFDVKQPVLTVTDELSRKPLPVVLVYLGTRENPSDSYEFTDGILSVGTIGSLCRQALQFMVTFFQNDPRRGRYLGANIPIRGSSWVQASYQLTCCYTALIENSDVPQIQDEGSQLELFMLKSGYEVELKKYARLIALVEMKESLITRENYYVQAIWEDLVPRHAQFGSASISVARESDEGAIRVSPVPIHPQFDFATSSRASESDEDGETSEQ